MREYIPLPAGQTIWEKLELPSDDAKLRELVTNGLPVKVLYRMVSLMGVSQASMLEALSIAPSTFLRRKKDGHFKMKESDRLYTLIQVLARVTDLFEGDRNAAVEWMTKKVPGLGHARPIDMLCSHVEAVAVLDLVTRLEYGVYS